MIDTYVFLVSHVDQVVVTLESVEVDDRAKVISTTNRGQSTSFCTVFDDHGVDLAVPLADAKDERVLASPTPSLALDATRAEVALVDFDGATERMLKLALLGQAFAQTGEKAVHAVAVEAVIYKQRTARSGPP